MRKSVRAVGGVGVSAAVVVGAYMAGVALAPDTVEGRVGERSRSPVASTPAGSTVSLPASAEPDSGVAPSTTPAQPQVRDGRERLSPREVGPSQEPTREERQQPEPAQSPERDGAVEVTATESEPAQPAPTPEAEPSVPAEEASSAVPEETAEPAPGTEPAATPSSAEGGAGTSSGAGAAGDTSTELER